jgi:hypothetical protein
MKLRVGSVKRMGRGIHELGTCFPLSLVDNMRKWLNSLEEITFAFVECVLQSSEDRAHPLCAGVPWKSKEQE